MIFRRLLIPIKNGICTNEVYVYYFNNCKNSNEICNGRKLITSFCVINNKITLMIPNFCFQLHNIMRVSVTLGLIISKTISMFTFVKGKAFIMS